jgi:hypothetical protein
MLSLNTKFHMATSSSSFVTIMKTKRKDFLMAVMLVF